MAIMGSSGAGKTSLLNLLTLRNNHQLRVTGDVKINGTKVNAVSELALIAGYVQQNDLFIGHLKVKEQLTFQVMTSI